MNPLVLIPIVMGFLKVVTDQKSREATNELITIAKKSWEVTDEGSKKEALAALAKKGEEIAHHLNQDEATKGIIVAVLEKLGNLGNSVIPPIIKPILWIPASGITIPVKWVVNKVTGNKSTFSEATIKVAQSGIASFIGTALISWFLACTLVRSVDQIEWIPLGGKPDISSANAKIHGKNSQNRKHGRVERRLLVGFGDRSFYLPYRTPLEFGFRILIAWFLLNIINYVFVLSTLSRNVMLRP